MNQQFLLTDTDHVLANCIRKHVAQCMLAYDHIDYELHLLPGTEGKRHCVLRLMGRVVAKETHRCENIVYVIPTTFPEVSRYMTILSNPCAGCDPHACVIPYATKALVSNVVSMWRSGSTCYQR